MESRLDDESTPTSASAAPGPSQGAALAQIRLWFAWPVRFTIAQLMLLTLVVGLALTPLAMIRKHDQIEHVVAMVAFETIGLPALVTLVLLITTPPGPQRVRNIVVLSLLPTLLIGAVVGLYFVASIPFMIYMEARDVAAGKFTHLPGMLFGLSQIVIQLSLRRSPRCPACRQRRLKQTSSKTPRADRSLWSIVYECQACGAQSTGTVWKLYRKPQPVSSEAYSE